MSALVPARVLTISIVDGQIEIFEGDERGGVVWARAEEKVKWERDPSTVSSFSLEFFRVNTPQDAFKANHGGTPAWPFWSNAPVRAGTVVDGRDFASREQGGDV